MPVEKRSARWELSREVTLSTTPTSTARRLTRTTLAHWGLAGLVDDSVLIVDELVTNAIRHDHSGSITLTLAVNEKALQMIGGVGDGSRVPPRLRAPGTDGESGRGLQMIGRLSTAWGWYPTTNGKVVWFALDIQRTSATPREDLLGYPVSPFLYAE
jgi:anti-sigma regulatory factor (Ser/Thr protein kinase)